MLVACLFLAAGCRSGLPLGPVVAPGEAVLPTPELNPDLLKWVRPSNLRDWSPDQAVLPYAEFHGDRVTVRNIRCLKYRTADDYDVSHYDKTFDLAGLDRVDLIVVPFGELPSLAHTMLSFGFEGGQHLGVSVEIRKERGEAYNPIKGFLRQYELMYVVADERDLIERRAIHDLAEVRLYRLRASPTEARALLVDVMRRVNNLAREPEFYDTLVNNCTTNVRDHLNHVWPGRVPYDYRVLLPGRFDELAYEVGLLDTDTTLERTRERAKVNYLACLYRDAPDFSARIRR